jgi:hypothetical protein
MRMGAHSSRQVTCTRGLVAACALGLWVGCGPTNVVKKFSAGPDDRDGGTGGDGDGGSDYVSMASDPACDMTGVWLVRQTNFASSLVDTTGGNWYYLEIEQTGDAFEVVDSFECGFQIFSPAASIVMSEKTEMLLSLVNSQVGRKGTMKRAGARCDFSMQRFWSLRGVGEEYVPGGRFDTRDIDEVEAVAPLPTKGNQAGAIDQDEDGKPGITMKIGNDDERYAVQRDWLEWFSCSGTASDHGACQAGNENDYSITPSAALAEIFVRSDFNNQDHVMGATSPLYELGGMPVRDKNNRVKFVSLGRTREAAAAMRFWALPSLKARCDEMRRVLPLEKESE